MIITVREVDWYHPQPVGRNVEAFWVEFDSELTSGQALLVPSSGGVHFFNGQDLSVETDQHAVEDLRVLAPGERHEPCLIPLPRKGDYQVIGQVRNVIVDEESGEPCLFDIWVDPAWFALTSEEVGEQGLVSGNRISFRAVGLVLYDAGL